MGVRIVFPGYMNSTTISSLTSFSSRTNNRSAEVLFNDITREYDEIIAANNSVYMAAETLRTSITQLSEAASERARVTSYFDRDYETKFRGKNFYKICIQ